MLNVKPIFFTSNNPLRQYVPQQDNFFSTFFLLLLFLHSYKVEREAERGKQRKKEEKRIEKQDLYPADILSLPFQPPDSQIIS